MSHGLFGRERLRRLAIEHSLTYEARQEALRVLNKLQSRKADGSLAALSETRVEQSFNERLFAEVFDYETLLRRGTSEYHLNPKQYFVSRYDDFSLGFFGPGTSTRIVSAEFKSPGADLDAPQASHGGLTPVEQAMTAFAADSNVEWSIVSNFDEMRLYHRGDAVAHERVFLSAVRTADELQHAYALFSRRTLLGEQGKTSPLARLWSGGSPMEMPPSAHRVRAVFEAMPHTILTAGATLPQLDDALQAALDLMPDGVYMWPLRSQQQGFDAEHDRITQNNIVDGTWLSRLEFTRDGVLRVEDFIDTDEEANKQVLNAKDIARRVGLFALMARRAFALAFSSNIVDLRFRMLDLKQGAYCTTPSDWISGGTVLRLPAGVVEADSAVIGRDLARLNDNDAMVRLVSAVTRELLYPFRTDAAGHVVRLAPSDSALRAVLAPVFEVAERSQDE